MKRKNLKAQLFQIMDEEELYWFKRSHEKWLLQGDHNTKFSHRVANGKKRKQTIFSMKDGESVISGDVNLIKYATEYYKTLFGLEFGNAYGLDNDLWSEEKRVTIHENQELIRPFSEDEVKHALFKMERYKVAGPDG